MSNALAKVLIIGVPLILSLSWFVYWVVRLARFGRRKKTPPDAPAAPTRDL
jgi:hypothetical protein